MELRARDEDICPLHGIDSDRVRRRFGLGTCEQWGVQAHTRTECSSLSCGISDLVYRRVPLLLLSLIRENNNSNE